MNTLDSNAKSASISETPARSSYAGFVIPNDHASTEHASYSLVEISKDTLLIRAAAINGLGTDYYKIDAKGEFHICVPGEYREK